MPCCDLQAVLGSLEEILTTVGKFWSHQQVSRQLGSFLKNLWQKDGPNNGHFSKFAVATGKKMILQVPLVEGTRQPQSTRLPNSTGTLEWLLVFFVFFFCKHTTCLISGIPHPFKSRKPALKASLSHPLDFPASNIYHNYAFKTISHQHRKKFPTPYNATNKFA